MLAELFERNYPALSEEEQLRLSSSVCLLCGCGGLGSSVAEYLIRAGVGKLIVYDGDRFTASNRNRQLLATEKSMGHFKAEVLRDRAGQINPSASVEVHTEFLTEGNIVSALKGVDLVLDCLDTVADRLMLERACEEARLPLVHGAVEAWSLQTGVILPGSRKLKALYAGKEQQPENASEKSCLSFTCGVCAGLQAAEAVKVLTGRESALSERILAVDLENMTKLFL